MGSDSVDPPLTVHRVTNTLTNNSVDVARVSDFETCQEVEVASFCSVEDWREHLLYCFVPERRCAYFVKSRRPLSEARTAPFLYAWQRDNAERLVAVPLERLAELGAASGMSPTFVLSIGRAGSTLLAALLRAMDRPVASEPDSFTSLAAAGVLRDEWGMTGESDIALRACVENLRANWGASPYIKLRGMCNVLVPKIARSFVNPRFIFVLRNRKNWAVSHCRAFGADINAMCQCLYETLSAYDFLVRNGFNPLIVWYEELCDDPIDTLRRIVGGDSAVCSEALVEAIMSEDSQAHTPLARVRLTTTSPSASIMEGFDRMWGERKPIDILRRYKLHQLE